MKLRRFELHVTNSKHVPFDNIPDLRGVANWQNLLRRLVFLVGLDSIQISKSQYRHFISCGNDVICSVFEY